MKKYFVVSLCLMTGVLGCNRKSSEIPERREYPVNSAVNPCEDFYEYTCSKVVDSFKLRDDRSRHVFSFSDSHERILEKKKDWLGKLASRPEKKLSMRAVDLQRVFNACMNEGARAKEEKEIVSARIQEIKKIKDKANFLAFLGKNVDRVQFAFVDFGSIANQDDPDWNDIYLEATLKNLPERSYYEKKELMADYEQVMTSFFKTVGYGDASTLAKKVLDLETEFAKTYPLPREIREVVNSRTGISKSDLLKRFPSFRLKSFLAKIPDRTKIRHLFSKNFESFEKILQKADLETLKAAYLYNEVNGYMDDAYPEFFRKKFDFAKTHLGGPKVRPERKERCTKMIMGRFGKEIDAELVPILFPNFPEKKFTQLVEKMRSTIVSGLKKNQWLGEKSRAAAIRKVQVAGLKLVQPKNDEEWDFNPPADYRSDRHYENMHRLSQNLSDKTIRELAKPRNRKKWLMSPLTINAYYSPSNNEFVMPIGILQYPFYDPQLEDEVNLGAVGVVVGHELGHGVDDMGSRYDHEGRLKQWMSQKDVSEFRKRGAKLIDQFNAIGHDGKLTLGENIGDLVGVTFAYEAAFPGGKGTAELKKKFFLQYGRLWCTVIRPKRKEVLLKTDPHAFGKERVNQQVMHQPGFSEAFGCKAGDPMVLPPQKQVRIW